MKTIATLSTRPTAREHPQPDWIQLFILAAGFILLAGALNRFLIAAGQAQVLSLPDPLLGIPLRWAVLIVGMFELTVALICLGSARAPARSGSRPRGPHQDAANLAAPAHVGWPLAWLAWLGISYVVFGIGLVWQHCPPQATCIGSLTDPLRLSHGITGYIFEFLPFGLVLGSCAAIFSFWLSKKSRTTRLAAARQLAEERDAAAGLLKMPCPSCGGHVKFPAQNIGQQIPCPHCQAPITLRKPEEKMKMVCVLCGGPIEFPSHAIGQKIPCPHCAKNITLLQPG